MIISNTVRLKLLRKHGGITDAEITECFANRDKGDLFDDRENHKTDPQSRWFISETDRGIKLKVVYIYDNGNVIIKTAYPPNTTEVKIYEKNAIW